MRKPPSFLLPKFIGLLRELGYHFQGDQKRYNGQRYELVEFRHADGTKLYVEHFYLYGTGELRGIKLMLGTQTKVVPGTYPASFELVVVKSLLAEMGIDVVSRLRAKRLEALLA